jgi:hypothetical protein
MNTPNEKNESKPANPVTIPISELFTKSFGFIGQHYLKLLGIFFAFLIIDLANELILNRFIGGFSNTSGIHDIFNSLPWLSWMLPVGLISLYFSIVLIEYLCRPDTNKPMSRYYKTAVTKYPMSLWLSFLLLIITLAPSFIIFTITKSFGWYFIFSIIGMIIGLYYSLAVFIYIDKGTKNLQALAASYDLVKDHWWAITGRMLLLYFSYLVISFLLGFLSIFNFIVSGFDSLIISIINVPLGAFYIIFLEIYFFNIYKSLSQMPA